MALINSHQHYIIRGFSFKSKRQGKPTITTRPKDADYTAATSFSDSRKTFNSFTILNFPNLMIRLEKSSISTSRGVPDNYPYFQQFILFWTFNPNTVVSTQFSDFCEIFVI